MAQVNHETGEVKARILYWGVAGAGKTENLKVIRRKLRADHRGELREVPTRLDPSLSYEELPIELGELGGLRTRIEVIAVPGGPEHAPTRKQLLDEVDGVVFVVDSQRDRIDENLVSFEELRRDLAAYGRSPAEVPIVVQYNKRDLSDPYALEELHRKLELPGAAVFEAVAHEGTAVLPTLTTISKRVIRTLRDRQPQPSPPEASLEAAPTTTEPEASLEAVSPPADLEPSPTPVELEIPAADPVADLDVGSELELDAEVEITGDAPDAAELEEASPADAIEAAMWSEAGNPEADSAGDLARETLQAFDTPLSPESGLDATEAFTLTAAHGALSIAEAGVPEVCGPHTLRIPLVLESETGERFPLKLTLELAPDPEGRED